MTTDPVITSPGGSARTSDATGPGTMPMAIRRAGPGDHVERSTLSQTPGGMNFYGSTPGGTKLMYSREQLLALSTSPLSRSPAQGLSAIPASISRSPEKSADFHQHKSGGGVGSAASTLLGSGAGGVGRQGNGSDADRNISGGGQATIEGLRTDDKGQQEAGRVARAQGGEEQFAMDL